MDGYVNGDSFPPVTAVPVCGNGVLDEGEECDDRNRYDGDGCDWLCRLGDGEPPPDPDPGVRDYVPAGAPIVFPDVSDPIGGNSLMPLVWTGSEFATVYLASGEEDGDPLSLRFRRFDETGMPLDAEWVYETPGPTRNVWGVDLVWTGSGFGLFYSPRDLGIMYLRLDPEGKPLGPPILVEPDPRAIGVAADLTPDGFVLAWNVAPASDPRGGVCSGSPTPPDTPVVRVRRVGFDGTTPAPAVTVETWADGPPDIATGDGGFGLTLLTGSPPFSCAFRFLWLADDFEEVVQSGVLEEGTPADVKWVEGHYVVGWARRTGGDASHWEGDICVGVFSPAGVLERPPVCNPVGSAMGGDVTRVAGGDGGLALLGKNRWEYGARLALLRTDAAGRAVGPPHDILPFDIHDPYEVSAYNIAWATDAFAVVFHGWSTDIRLQLFVPE